MDKKRLIVLVDTSGSMAEMGRHRLLQRLMMQVEEFDGWDEMFSEVLYIPVGQEPLKNGRSGIAALRPTGWISAQQIDDTLKKYASPQTALLFISDGGYHHTQLLSASHRMHHDFATCAALTVGAGSDEVVLEKLVGTGSVYKPSRIWRALSYLAGYSHDK